MTPGSAEPNTPLAPPQASSPQLSLPTPLPANEAKPQVELDKLKAEIERLEKLVDKAAAAAQDAQAAKDSAAKSAASAQAGKAASEQSARVAAEAAERAEEAAGRAEKPKPPVGANLPDKGIPAEANQSGEISADFDFSKFGAPPVADARNRPSPDSTGEIDESFDFSKFGKESKKVKPEPAPQSSPDAPSKDGAAKASTPEAAHVGEFKASQPADINHSPQTVTLLPILRNNVNKNADTASASSTTDASTPLAIKQKLDQPVSFPPDSKSWPSKKLARWQYDRAFNEFFSGEYDSVVRRLTIAIRLDGRDARFYYFRGLANYRQEQLSEAQRDIKAAAALEVKGSLSSSEVGRALERIQYAERRWLEQLRCADSLRTNDDLSVTSLSAWRSRRGL